jgi:hypothetical protein
LRASVRRSSRVDIHRIPDIDLGFVLGICEAVTYVLADMFRRVFVQYYPNAKMISNRRNDVDTWRDSMQKTCWEVFSWPIWVLSWANTRMYRIWLNLDLAMRGYYIGTLLSIGDL